MSLPHCRPGSSTFFRLVEAACPQPERAWLRALAAESSSIEQVTSRLSWIVGALTLVASGRVRYGAAALREHSLKAAVIALVGATLLALTGHVDPQFWDVDDDLFLAGATIFGGGLLSATALARLLRPAPAGPL